jgi:hypothetical protein
VANRNDPPVAQDDLLPSVDEDTPGVLIAADTLLANDAAGPNDIEDAVRVIRVEGALGGTVNLASGITFLPTPDHFGSAGFEYVISDNDGLEARRTVRFEVLPINDPPSFTLRTAAAFPGGTAGERTIVGFASDLSPDPGEADQGLAGFTVAVTSDPDDVVEAAALDLEGTLSIRLSGQPGTARYTARLEDALGRDGAPQEFVVSVAARSADLSVTIEADVLGGAGTGEAPISWAVVVRNAGPDGVTRARVQHPAPAGLGAITWICEAVAGATCTEGGVDTLDDTIDLAVEGAAIYVYTAELRPAPTVHVALVATVDVPLNAMDPDSSNNTAVATLATDGLFEDGFEDPENPLAELIRSLNDP